MSGEIRANVDLDSTTEADIPALDELQASLTETFMKPEVVLNDTPVLPLTMHIFSACFCLGCSALFHLFTHHDKQVATVMARLDYSGISILIFGSTIPVSYYGYACDNTDWGFWIYMITMGIACLACFIVTLLPKFDQPEYRKWRGIMFIILGLGCSILFIGFAFYDYGIVHTNFWLWALGGYIYIQGAVIYVIRVPERCSPGTFDLCGQSHQIFHFAILIACTLMYSLNYQMYLDRQNYSCPIWTK